MVTVIMPVHNSAAFLAQAIDSVIGQSYEEWELIIIDDCSEDTSDEIIRSYVETDRRIIPYRNKKNIGVAESRNIGIKLAKGDWIAFLDSDDIWRREKLENQLKLSECEHADLIYSSYALFSTTPDGERRKDYMVPRTVSYHAMLRENYIGCSTVLVRKEVLARHRFSSAIYHEDYALWLELLRSGIKAVGCREVLVDWRICPHSRSANKMFAAKKRWEIYRNIENLPLHTSIYCFANYAFHGVVKRCTGYKKY